MKKVLWIVGFLFGWVLGLKGVEPFPSYRVYYVSPSGRDTYPGTADKPWATPAVAVTRLRPGDTLVVKKGIYILSDYEKDRIVPPSGRPGAWITLRGEKGAILAGRENLAMLIDLSGKEYICIQNLEITSFSGQPCRDGIAILEKPAHHIVLQDLVIHHLDEFGVNIQDGDHLLVSNCRIHHCGFGAIGGPQGNHGGWKNVRILASELSYSGHYYQGTSGPGPYDRPDGCGIEASEGPVEIAFTTVAHNRGDGIDSKAYATYIHHCTVANNRCDGIKLWGDKSKVENSLVYGRGDGNKEGTPWAALVIQSEREGASFSLTHLTIDDEIGQNYMMYVQYDTPKTRVNVTIQNCIFSSRGERAPLFVGERSMILWENNLFFFPRCEEIVVHGDQIYTKNDISRLGISNHYGNPFFEDAKNQRYFLHSQSPAIDAGRFLGYITNDRNGISRPQRKAPDLGAYEMP
ncbi:MAG: right-handed parallel beta-helix repeat-containing protein [Brevinematales bacterium]|nr:right-handed parallel beta-helix repeat-containing protein [Brevinematales bacterium]